MISKKNLIPFLNRVVIPFVILIILTRIYFMISIILLKNKDLHLFELSMLSYEIAGIIIGVFFVYYFKLYFKFPRESIKNFLPYLFLTLLFGYLFTLLFLYRDYNLKPVDFSFSLKKRTLSYLMYFTLIIIDPVNEELFFRHVIFDYFIKRNRFPAGIITNSFLFALAHMLFYATNNYIDFIQFFLMAVTFSVIRLRFGWIYSVISHSMINFMGFLFLDKVSDLYIMDYFRGNIIFWWIWGFAVLLYLILLFLFYRTINKIS